MRVVGCILYVIARWQDRCYPYLTISRILAVIIAAEVYSICDDETATVTPRVTNRGYHCPSIGTTRISL